MEQLLEATDGRIYATNAKGVYRYDGSTWTPVFLSPENHTFNFTAIRELSDQSIIVGSNWGFLHFLPGDDLRMYSSEKRIVALRKSFPEATTFALPPAALSGDGQFVEATDILQLKSGEIWLALTTEPETGKILSTSHLTTASGIAPDFTTVQVEDELLGEDLRLFQASDDRIWVVNSTIQ